MKHIRFTNAALMGDLFMVLFALVCPQANSAAPAVKLDRNARGALQKLYAKTPVAKTLGERARRSWTRALLPSTVFPVMNGTLQQAWGQTEQQPT